MVAHKLQASLSENGTLTLKALPFPAGTVVDIIILESNPVSASDNPYPLHNTPYRYDQPFEPVSIEDWEALQ